MAEVRANPTREKVAVMEKEGKSAKEIAAALDMSTATVYNHLRQLHPDKPRKRGRPRKTEAEKAAAVETPKAETPVKTPKRRGRPPKAATATANGNGVNVDLSDLRSNIQSMIDVKRAEISKLNEMLALTK